MVTVIVADTIEAADEEAAEQFGNDVVDGVQEFSYPAVAVMVEQVTGPDAEAA